MGTGTATGTAIGISEMGERCVDVPGVPGVAALNKSLSTLCPGVVCVRDGVLTLLISRCVRVTAGLGIMQSRSPSGTSQAAAWYLFSNCFDKQTT